MKKKSIVRAESGWKVRGADVKPPALLVRTADIIAAAVVDRCGRAHRFQGDRLSAAHGGVVVVRTLCCMLHHECVLCILHHCRPSSRPTAHPTDRAHRRRRWFTGCGGRAVEGRCVETAAIRPWRGGGAIYCESVRWHRSVGVSGRVVVILSHDKIDLGRVFNRCHITLDTRTYCITRRQVPVDSFFK